MVGEVRGFIESHVSVTCSIPDGQLAKLAEYRKVDPINLGEQIRSACETYVDDRLTFSDIETDVARARESFQRVVETPPG